LAPGRYPTSDANSAFIKVLDNLPDQVLPDGLRLCQARHEHAATRIDHGENAMTMKASVLNVARHMATLFII